MLIHPLIKKNYIQPLGFYDNIPGNPFDFPMNLDDSAVDAKEEMVLFAGFLYQHSTAKSTLANYTKEMEKFCQWLWRVKKVGLFSIDKEIAEEFVGFIKSPPYHWISRGSSSQKFLESGEPCCLWRPFAVRGGSDFNPSARSVGATISVLRCFYNFLIDESLTQSNPFARIK